MTTTPTLWTREGESFLGVRDADPGNCTVCSRPLIDGWFRWDDWTPDPESPFPGTGRFTSLRHADGSPNHASRFGLDAKNRCPDCKGEDLSYKDGNYGTTARCPCGWNQYTDRGD